MDKDGHVYVTGGAAYHTFSHCKAFDFVYNHKVENTGHTFQVYSYKDGGKLQSCVKIRHLYILQNYNAVLECSI
jgi:hypothetical protein